MLEANHDMSSPSPSEPLRVLFPSPIGQLAVELTGEAISRLTIRPDNKQQEGYTPFQEIEDSDFLDEVFGRLSEYFAGARRRLELDFDLGPSGTSGFHRKVLKETAKIPFGRTRTYGRLAEKVGRPDAYRMVLSALVENPIPIIIPCHRVVTNKSGIGSYIGGKETKRWLLDMEKEALARDEEG